MELNAVLDTLDGVDEPFKTLYSERDGKFMLTGIKGVKTEADVARVQSALNKERETAKTFKTQLDSYASLGALEELQAKLDKFPELEAAAQGKLNDEQINQVVETRLKSKLSPLERDLAAKDKALQETTALAQQLQAQIKTRQVHDAVGSVARELKVLDTAYEDVLMYAERLFEVAEDGKVVTKEGVGVDPGLSPKVWLEEIKAKRPHWWPASQGGGAGGGGLGDLTNNPWAPGNWNLTAQASLVRADPAKAERMAKAAGSYVGAIAPAKK